MNAKKQRAKARRRAQKLADQAWEAAYQANLVLAARLIGRAVQTQPTNPLLWHHQGLLLRLSRNEPAADRSFRTALSLAPDYAECYAELAKSRIRQGRIDEAVALQEQAVRHAPHERDYGVRLASYRAMQSGGPPADRAREPVAQAETCAPRRSPMPDELARKLAAVDREGLQDHLTREGLTVIPSLLDDRTCAEIGQLFDDDALFARTVVMDRPSFGNGVYRYFRAPIPGVVDQLRRSVYPLVARIANGWEQLLGRASRFPSQWSEFAARCHEAGQRTPTPLLIRYGPGGFNALHRDLRGDVYFPIQMAVVLSPRAGHGNPQAEGFAGGDFLLCDVPQLRKSQRSAVAAGLGDAVLFCTRDRLVAVGGVWGLQPVKHGVSTITAGTRVVLAVPFHEYR